MYVINSLNSVFVPSGLQQFPGKVVVISMVTNVVQISPSSCFSVFGEGIDDHPVMQTIYKIGIYF